MHELTALVLADLRSARNRFNRGSWGERAGTAAALLVVALFSWGCQRFFLRIFDGILRLRSIESMLPSELTASLEALTARLLAMTALTALSALFASSLVTGLAAAIQARDLPLLLAQPLPRLSLYGHRLARSTLAAGAPILLFLLPTAHALGSSWGHPWQVTLAAAGTGLLLTIGTAALGLALVLLLLRVFPAGRTAQTITSISTLALAVVIGAVRAVRPERLFNPASGEDLLSALKSLELPALNFYPSSWMTDCWMAVATGAGYGVPAARLALYCAAAVSLGGICFVTLHRHGWIRAREAPAPALPGAGTARRLGHRLCALLPRPMAAVARLELASITRDSGQWTQLALLAALSGLYLYNLRLIPGDQRIVGPLLALLNVGVAGLVLSAVALRLGLPSVSRDGPHRWLPETSPLSAYRRLLAKSLVVGTPLMLLGGGLTLAAAGLVPAPLDLKAHAVVAVLMMGPALAAMAVGVGARFPRYDAADASQATIGSGGLLGFALMLLYTGAMTVLSARPVFSWYLTRIGFDSGPSTVFLASLLLQLALSLLLGAGALWWGARFLEKR
jgi:ABC-2 type transport system permease protein